MKTMFRLALSVALIAFFVVVHTASAATITVNSTEDTTTAGDGNCTLREAITNANGNIDSTSGDCAAGEADPTVDVIDFNLTGGGPYTISPSLPYTITSKMTIDGTTQTGTSCPLESGNRVLQINIDGQGFPPGDNGGLFSIAGTANGVTIKGLAIYGNNGGSAVFSSADNLTVQCSNLGVDATGLTSHPNMHGVSFFSDAGSVTSGHMIGGPNSGDGNLISGNGYTGVSWQGVGVMCNANNMTIQGNWIGVNGTGQVAMPNSSTGIACGNGGFGSAELSNIHILNNVISGNGVEDDNYSPGVNLGGAEEPGGNATVSNVTFKGNIIGLSVDQSQSIPNEDDGIFLGTALENITVGGEAPGERNIISGNNGSGLFVGYVISNVVIIGNIIGGDDNGNARGNQYNGLTIGDTGTATSVTDVHDITIGGTSVNDRNIIVSNGSDGIHVGGAQTVTISGNYIGVIADGSTCAENSGSGIYIADNSSVTIGGLTPNEKNIIGCNDTGIRLEGETAGVTATIIGNSIGIGADGTSSIPNNNYGIVARGNVHGSIGGATAEEANTVANNRYGVSILERTSYTVPKMSIVRNSITNNTNIGIDLSLHEGSQLGHVTPNDALDSDSGANDMLNYPVVLSTVQNVDDTIVTYSLDVPVGTYRVEFFTNPTHGLHSSGNGEGEVFKDYDTVTVSEPGIQLFQKSLANTMLTDVITATTTLCGPGCVTYTETSEFSNSAPPGVDYGTAAGSQTTLAQNGAAHLVNTVYLGACVNGDSGDATNGDSDGAVQPGSMLGTAPCTDDRDGVIFVNGEAVQVPGVIGETSYTPSGVSELDDAQFSGDYTGAGHYYFFAAVTDTSGPADTFIYAIFDGSDFIYLSSPMTITPGEPQLLQDGVYITFQNATGHTPTDGEGGAIWSAEVTPAQYELGDGSTNRTDPYVTGDSVVMAITASDTGMVNVWIDSNDDGDFSDAGEHVITNQPVFTGQNGAAFTAPDTVGTHAVRVRYTSYTPENPLPYGLETDGEVEDYSITVIAPTEPTPITPSSGGGIVPIGCIDPGASNFSTQVVINTGCTYAGLFQHITPSVSASSLSSSTSSNQLPNDCKPGYAFSPSTGMRCEASSATLKFTKNLKLGMTDPEVKLLQQYLNNHGHSLAVAPKPGSSGYETVYFGPATQTALAQFQKDHSITPAIGFFGPITRQLIATTK